MNIRKSIRTIILMLALFMGAANGAWALEDTDIVFDPVSPSDGGTVELKSIVGQTVTITVKPNQSKYCTVKRENIVVQKLQNLDQAQARRRTPDIANYLEVTGAAESESPADYTFEVPTGYVGALVTVTFTTMPLNAYTYNIIDTQGNIAIKCTVNQPDGLPLTSYTDIPEVIRSPYLAGETVTFYSFAGAFSTDNLIDANKIDETPVTSNVNIYVKYTTTQLSGKPLNLSGATPYKIQVNGQYIYDNKHGLRPTVSDGDNNNDYLWKVTGSDPYRLQIQNLKSIDDYLVWSISPSASLTLDDSPSNFIILGGNAAAPEGFNDQIELMAATGEDIGTSPYYNVGRDTSVGLLASGTYGHGHDAIQVLLKAVERTITFHIIDLSGHIVVEQSGNYSTLDVPAQWKSPLVKENGYHFYTHENFQIRNGVYTLRQNQTEISDILAAPADIYVIYEPSDTYDLDGSENRATDGKKYLLKFAGGTSFQQENGKDGFEATAKEGIYPYINGEGGLFVYGQDKYNETEKAVGSTRTRWFWYLEGGDPYRLRIASLQTNTDGSQDNTHYSYLRTYKPQGYDKVVTGAISNNPKVSDGNDDTDPTGSHDARHVATDYMVLYGTEKQGGGYYFRLVTSDVVDDDGKRHTVTSFENYWKTNPTAIDVVKAYYNDESIYKDGEPTAAQKAEALVTGQGWHSYDAWARAKTWTRTTQIFEYGEHWFKTIDVGTLKDGVYNGDFELEEKDLDGALILLDKHGWEVMRKPITNLSTKKEAYAQELRKYDSPMVKKYHFWTNFTKEPGYHKFKPTRGTSKDTKEVGVGTSLADYPEVFSTGTLADIYVTYEVMVSYRDGYRCAEATGTVPSAEKYLIRQGTNYAKATEDGTNIILDLKPAAEVTDVSTASNDLLWYVKPNINIDTEMGYNYAESESENGSNGELTQTATELAYYNNRDQYYVLNPPGDNINHHPNDTIHDPTNGQNGFDPYNLQIESVAHPDKLFTTNATGTGLDGNGSLEATYDDPSQKTVTLQTYAAADPFTVTDYYDLGTAYQRLHVTNSTFMAVSDANGNIRLMPRFDHHNVVTSFTILAAHQAAEPYGDESGTQTTLFVHPSTSSSTPGEVITVSSSDEITDMNGNYQFDEKGFDITKVIGTAAKPFTGTIDGRLITVDGVNRPLVAYANGATIKNVILKTVTINAGNADGNAGAICCQATGDTTHPTRIYNCGILPTTTERNADGDITGFTGSHVSGTENVGGIVGSLDGNARVINCFSYAEIKSGTTVAGIVGNIGYTTANPTINQDNVATMPMVVNCMFYGDITATNANIAPVYGGITYDVEGITNYVMIKNDADKGVNPYCYFRKEAPFHNKTNFPNLNSYRRSWPAEEKNLTRFEYYRSILNSNRRLCTWWITNKQYGSTTNAPTETDEALVAKWVLDPEIAPYPILKKWGKYPSVINLDPVKRTDPLTKAWVNREDASDHWETHRAPDTDGQILGSITVYFDGGDHYTGSTTPASKPISITAMDTESYDYCYGKIQLPYYNEIFGNPKGTTWSEKYGDNYGEYVVTGWDIIEVNGSTTGSGPDFVADWETGYNFADRTSTKKDLKSVSGRTFAQGGYYYVPDGVTSIKIKAHWGKAFYLANRGHSIDRVNLTKFMTGDNDNYYKVDKPFTPAGTVSNKFLKTADFDGYTVYNDLQTVIKDLDVAEVKNDVPSLSVYDQAIVLIGNHQVQNASQPVGYDMRGGHKKWHPFTIMSADFDFDNEPDYCLELQFRRHIDRPGIQPIRFDFLPVVELGLAVRPDEKAYAIGVLIPQGHFEVTETSFMRTTQFEYDASVDRIESKSPMIINGGEYEMFNVRKHDANRTSYFLLGGKAWVHRFAPGAHPNSGDSPKIKLCAVNAIGGEYKEFYLSGLYRPELPTPDNQGAPHCYTDGGKFDIMAGAGYDKVAGGVTFKINHSLIKEFYGGGINGTNPIGGNIEVTIDNSRVNKYCGGPKVGSMAYKDNNVTKYKTVTTHATGTTFDVFYGGGNGGNSYYRQMQDDGDWDSPGDGTNGIIGETFWTNRKYNWTSFNPLGVKDDGTDNKGYHAEYEFEVFNQSNGLRGQITQRGFIRWIQFGITTTGNVTNTLTDCTVNTDFFGGGNLATVNGTVESTLTNTKVLRNVFGAGYSAAIPTFTVHDKEKKTFPSMDFAGTITDGEIPNVKDENGEDIEYEWTNNPDTEDHDATYMKAHPTYSKTITVDGEEVTKWYCYTWNPLKNLGAVLNHVTLTLEGDTEVGHLEKGVLIGGNVYGGGDASTVGHVKDPDDNTDVNVIANTTVNLQGNTHVLGNVFGGGNEGIVNGDAKVNIRPETPTSGSGSGEGAGEGSGSSSGNG